ncbi:MAG: PIN domain-containing protein [Eggerthellaceae bacterium]|nr:PIN domain-containing protein [Eggerthellaceae bacterium]
MMKNPPIIVVDTSVWLDNYLADRPNAGQSRSFIMQARESGVQLTYPIHCLNDIYLLIQSHLKRAARSQGELTEDDAAAIREIAWACIENMREFATAVGADESDAWKVCKYRHLTNDLEDNFVLAAAERVPADFLVTNDQRLLRKSTVNAYTPEDAVIVLKTIQQQSR